MLSLKPRPFVQSSFDMQAPLCVCVCVCVFSFVYLGMSRFPSTLFFLPFPLFLGMESVRRTFFPSEWCFSPLLVTTGWIFQGSSRYNFCSVQMVMVSRNHGYKWFAVMVFTLSRLEHGWFRRNSVCCGPVYGPWLSLRFGCGPVYDSRLSLRVGFGPVCTQHISSLNATSAMPSTLGIHSPLRTNSSIFLHPPSLQQPPLVPIAHPGDIGCVFLAAQQFYF